MTGKTIRNEQWYVKDLIAKIDNDDIHKPKYQRKKKWDVHPKKDNVPNEKSYIQFLYDTKNSVHAITFGQESIHSTLYYTNIDGNNRINAIKHFMERPFEIFDTHLNSLFHFIDSLQHTKNDKENISKQDAETLKDIFRGLSYSDVIHFKFNKYFKEHGRQEWYEKVLKIHRDEFDEHIEKIQSNIKLHGSNDYFDTNVKVNVNIFEGYNTDELCNTFEAINKYNSKLTETELLASRLFHESSFKIQNPSLELEIKKLAETYYEQKAEGEALECYRYDSKHDVLNAHDFIVCFQNWCHHNCKFISPSDVNDMSIFYKLFKYKYGGFKDTFTTENVNDFIEHIQTACQILNSVCSFIFTDQINEHLFSGSCQQKLSKLGKNNTVLVLSCIIGHLQKNTNPSIIQNELQKGLLFHFMVNDLKTKSSKDEFKQHDSIAYNAGGAFVENQSKIYLKSPHEFNANLNRAVFKTLIEKLCDEANEPHERRLDNGNNRREKRRPLRFTDKVLMFHYYQSSVPTNMLNQAFSIEHICPNSCDWKHKLDKDRLGNMVPIHANINSARQNKHLSEYLRIDNGDAFYKYMDDIVPRIDTYDSIVCHMGSKKKPIIIDNEGYNEMCKQNENVYKNTFLNTVYK